MKKREDIVQKFSTFLSFGDSNSRLKTTWQVDFELERQMKRLTQSAPEAKAEFWARYFLKTLRGVDNEGDTVIRRPGELKEELFVSLPQEIAVSSSKAGRHLSAYLQEACLWAAQKSYQNFIFLRHKYPLEEYFQIANSITNPPTKLLRTFDFNHPKTNLEGYARTAILRFIGNNIYQQDIEAKRGKFSDYGLLKDLTLKELKEALLSQGINQSKIESYCLAWQCFDEIFQPNQSQGGCRLHPPNQKDLQQIASYYNQQCNSLNLPVTPTSGKKIQEILSTCIQAAREHRTRRFLPLEDYENLSGSIPTLWETVMQNEELEKVQEIVAKLFYAMPESSQTMVKLWQGLNLTQTEIATILKHQYPDLQKQYQVARQLGRLNRNLLIDLAVECKKIYPEQCLNGDKDIEVIKDYLHECLQIYCQNLFYQILGKFGEIWNDQKELLNLKNEMTMNNSMALSKEVMDVQQCLIQYFINELETSMGLASGSLDSATDKVANFIAQWLKNTSFKSNNGDG